MTAQIIQFPVARSRVAALSAVARAIYRDICWRTAGRNVLVAHSINDGVVASGGSRRQVVQARQELRARGFLTLMEPGNGGGPAIWAITEFEYSASTPDGAA